MANKYAFLLLTALMACFFPMNLAWSQSGGEGLILEILSPVPALPTGVQERLTKIEKLIADGADVNAKNQEGYSALVLASLNDDLDVAKLLLEKGAQVNVKGEKDGLCPLMAAAFRGNTNLVKLLLAHKADIKATSNTGESALAFAASGGNSDAVSMLLSNGADVKGARLHDGWTILMSTAFNDDVESARAILGKKPEVGAVNKEGNDALMVAVLNGCANMAHLLLDHGANPNSKTKEEGLTPLMVAVQAGQTDIARALLEKKADPNAKNKEQETPLLMAVGSGDDGMVALLLNYAAAVNTERLKQGVTPLMLAAQNGNTDIMRMLLDKGAQIGAKSANGTTSLLLAADSGNPDAVVLLLEKGSAIDEADKRGFTALMAASLSGNLEVARLLLDKGANVNAKTNTGANPLMLASFRPGNGAVVGLLLDHKADCAAVAEGGGNAWILANVLGDKKILELLKKCAADQPAKK